MKPEQTQIENGFSGKWIWANVLGWGVGLAAFQAVLSYARLGFYDPIDMTPAVRVQRLSPYDHTLGPVLVGMLFGAIVGAMLGVTQLFFRRRAHNILWWLLISSLGGVIFSVATLTILRTLGDTRLDWIQSVIKVTQSILPGPTIGIVVGIGVGLMQWLVLRQRMLKPTVWIAASAAAGAFLASLIFGLIQIVLQLRVSLIILPLLYIVERMMTTWTMPWMMPFAVAAILSGLSIGLAQWFVLRPWLPRAHWWLLANAAGSLLGWSATPDPVFWRTFSAIMPPVYLTSLLAIMQWTTLHSKVRNAGWWIPVSTAAGTIGLFAGKFIVSLLFAVTIRDALALAIIFLAFAPILALAVGAISGGIYGMITALLLKRLLKDSLAVAP